MIVWTLVAVIVVLVGVVVWLLRPGPKRGGMIRQRYADYVGDPSYAP